MTFHCAIDGLYHSRDMAELRAPWRRETDVLPDGQQALRCIVPALGARSDQRPERCECKTLTFLHECARNGMTRPHEDAEVLTALAVSHRHGLAASEISDQCAEALRQSRFRQQQQLGVEDAARDAHRAARRRDVGCQPTAHIEGQTCSSEPSLQQDEAAALADIAARLVALEEEAVQERLAIGVECTVGPHLGKHLGAGPAHRAHEVGVLAGDFEIDDQPGQAAPHERRKRLAGACCYRTETEPERASRMRGDSIECLEHAVEPRLEFGIEDADGAGP
ncbi:MAG TPA: hypothetical protein VGI48_09760 [Caldimonas sp.]